MACPHAGQLKSPSASARIFKDECTLCFDSEMLDLCLTCYNGSCPTHTSLHLKKTNHPVSINIQRIPIRSTTGPPQKMTKLEIKADEEPQFELKYHVKCHPCNIELTKEAYPDVAKVSEAVLNALSAKKQSDVKAWEEEIKPCTHTQHLKQFSTPQLNLNGVHCKKCDLTQNLWFCLTCGSVGCGRQQFGGIGGNGHGMNHYEETKHPVAVKLGTIKPEGGADVFCYECGEERTDPLLSSHLAHFGINIASQQQTEKSLAELQLEQNLKFDFSMATEDGIVYEPVFGPGLTGLKNLGNTCYMASVIQTVFTFPSFTERYSKFGNEHILGCDLIPADCFHCQMTKLCNGLLSGRYSVPAAKDSTDRSQDGISPSMFKALIGKNHAEFSTMRQQDAMEFFEHFMSVTEQQERRFAKDPTSVLKFTMEEKLQCLTCNKVRYKDVPEQILSLFVPLKRKKGVIADAKTPDVEVYESVSFNECLKLYFDGSINEGYTCPSCQQASFARIRPRFKKYPSILTFAMKRFIIGDNYVMKKLEELPIVAPLTLDLNNFRATGPQPGEELLPNVTSSKEASVNQEALNNLLQMGFPENRAKKALIKTGNSDAETAMNWLFEHMDDPDIDAPLIQETQGVNVDSFSFSSQEISMLQDMGFTEKQAKRALKETNGNMDRAVDWLFSHADMPMDEEPIATTTGSNVHNSGQELMDTYPANYELKAFISHKGTSVSCGHYVAHVKQSDGRWILFNDNKVVHVPDTEMLKATGEGYLYFYSRNQ